MSYLRQVPDFLRALESARVGRWSQAMLDFNRTSQILMHASKRDHVISSLYSATCEYYSGNILRSHEAFLQIHKNTADYPDLAATSARMALCTILPNGTFSPQSMGNPWIQLCMNEEPEEEGSFARSVYLYEKDPTQKTPIPHNGNEENALCNVLLQMANNSIEQLPLANTEKRDIKTQMELVDKALKAGECLGNRAGAEFPIIAKWYIGRSLMLRGRLFEFSGNAVMAEAMFNAAIDQSKNPITPRLNALRAASTNALGELLLKWEKRENEGNILKQQYYSYLAPASFMNKIIMEPTIEEISYLENV